MLILSSFGDDITNPNPDPNPNINPNPDPDPDHEWRLKRFSETFWRE